MDKAVTIDTSAILQEKYKSYVYLRATPLSEKDNLSAGEAFTEIDRPIVHPSIKASIHSVTMARNKGPSGTS